MTSLGAMGSHGGVPWDPGVGTMGAPWVGSLSLLGLKGPLGLLDPWASWTLGPLGPQGLIGPQGLMAPEGIQGSGVMTWMRLVLGQLVFRLFGVGGSLQILSSMESTFSPSYHH